MTEPTFQADAAGLSRILNHMPETVVVVSRDGTILYLNQTEPGYAPERFIGMDARELVHPEHADLFDEHFEALETTGESQEYEIRVQVEGSLDLWMRTRMLPLGDPAACREVLMISDDISEEKRLEAEARKLRRLLPVCSWCGRIRDEDGEWSDLETYVARREKTRVSHGICQECSERELGEVGAGDPGDRDEGNSSNGSAA